MVLVALEATTAILGSDWEWVGGRISGARDQIQVLASNALNCVPSSVAVDLQSIFNAMGLSVQVSKC